MPDSIHDGHDAVPSTLPPPASETEVLAELRALAARNTVTVPMIGLGYAGTVTPAVIRRNVIENPAWYTAYTPYQPEISQGRLEALLTFQTTVADLTGLPVAGASLLDEATAAAEAMTLLRRAGRTATSPRFVVDADTLPADASPCCGRGPSRWASSWSSRTSPTGCRTASSTACCVSYPGASGAVRDPAPLIEAAHERGALVAVAADLLALTLLTPPGELGADAALGTTQRFGVPLGFGGPARRVPVRAAQALPPAPRPARRDVARRRRQPGAAPRPPDP